MIPALQTADCTAGFTTSLHTTLPTEKHRNNGSRRCAFTPRIPCRTDGPPVRPTTVSVARGRHRRGKRHGFQTRITPFGPENVAELLRLALFLYLVSLHMSTYVYMIK